MAKVLCPVCDPSKFEISRYERQLLKDAGYCLNKCKNHQEIKHENKCHEKKPECHEKKHECHEKRYDYIVLGTGAGGSVVARTLSDEKNVSVLLVEWGLDLRSDPVVVNVSSEYGQFGPYRRTKNDFMQEVNTAGVFNSIVNFR